MQARRIAANIAKLPEMLVRPQYRMTAYLMGNDDALWLFFRLSKTTVSRRELKRRRARHPRSSSV